MKIQTFKLSHGILSLFMILFIYETKAQNPEKTPLSKDILLSIQNIKQTDSKTLEFDLYLSNKNPAVKMELASFQAGINFNPEILDGAPQTPTMVEIIKGSSELYDTLVPIRANSSESGLIKLAGRPLPGKGKGNILPVNNPGLRICRLKFTNSIPFRVDSDPELIFTSSKVSVNSYATRVIIYYDGANLPLEIVPLENAVVVGSIVLNPASKK